MTSSENWQAQSVVARLLARGESIPAAPAFEFAGRTIHFGELAKQSLATAAAIQVLGLGLGEHCAVVVGTTGDFPRILFGVQLAGGVPCVMNPQTPIVSLTQRILAAECVLVIAEEKQAMELTAAGLPKQIRIVTVTSLVDVPSRVPLHGPRFPNLDSPSHLLVTSGTTGESKLAVLLHRNVVAYLRAQSQAFPPLPTDRLIGWAPLHHAAGLTRFILWSVYEGLPSALLPPTMTSIPEWLRWISRGRATIVAGPDSAYRFAAKTDDPAGIDLGSLRYAISGGEPVRLATIDEFERRFGISGVIRPAYGLTEAALAATTVRMGQELRTSDGIVSSGPPLPGVELRIVDEDAVNLEQGRAGELLIRSDQVFAGYYNDPTATNECIIDGWFRSGDVAKVDSDGWLYIVGRKRVMIKRGGAMISPRDIEDSVATVESIRACAAIGVPSDSMGGDDVVVVVEVDPETLTKSVRRELSRRVAQRTVAAVGVAPSRVLMLAPGEIPRTSNGKFRHSELRRRLAVGEWPVASD